MAQNDASYTVLFSYSRLAIFKIKPSAGLLSCLKTTRKVDSRNILWLGQRCILGKSRMYDGASAYFQRQNFF